ncbi:unnamed protein product [Paramecium octaurelia]|uniref:Uncharacterized protein n=1 Tax=Paramecium octaurelia TaxID=43137 RepID=A0A8S1YMC0_PAROT|nr:unnamed protein product [Paramecium octaurelia]
MMPLLLLIIYVCNQHSQQLIHQQKPQTNPFKIKLRLEDIIIHQANEIQQHQKLETKVLQVKEEEQEIVQAYIRKEYLLTILTFDEILERLRQDMITDYFNIYRRQDNFWNSMYN